MPNELSLQLQPVHQSLDLGVLRSERLLYLGQRQLGFGQGVDELSNPELEICPIERGLGVTKGAGNGINWSSVAMVIAGVPKA